MGKKIDLSRTVYDLTTQYPELIEMLAGLGLTDIRKKFLRNSVGKLITIPKGAGMHGIEMKAVIDALEQQGFEIVGAGKPTMSAETLRPVAENTRTEQLKGYLFSTTSLSIPHQTKRRADGFTDEGVTM